MSHQHEEGCCSGHGHHHENHSHEECHEHSHGSCCHEENHEHSHGSCCHEEHECHSQEKYSTKLLQLADQAWMEVLKDKIKQEIHKHSGDHLTQIAQVVASANCKRWHSKIESKARCAEYEAHLHSLMCCQNKKH